jgi:hypothetical protein
LKIQNFSMRRREISALVFCNLGYLPGAQTANLPAFRRSKEGGIVCEEINLAFPQTITASSLSLDAGQTSSLRSHQ